MISIRFLWTVALALATAVVVFSFHRATMRPVLDAADPLIDAAVAPPRAEPSFAMPTDPARSENATSTANAGQSQSQAQHLQSAMPESYRNTSLLIAIRNAGYICMDIVSSASGTDDMAAWRVACDGALVYLVSVDDAGRVVVDPIPYAEGLRAPIEIETAPPRAEPLPIR